METEAKLNEAVVYLVDKLKAGVDFAIEEAPEVIQQMLLLHRIEALGAWAITLAFAVIGVFSIRYWRGEERDVFLDTFHTVAILASVIVVIVVPIASFDFCVSAWFAPKWHIVNLFLGTN